MSRRRAALVAFFAAALAGCPDNKQDPYRHQGNPPGQNPAGTPADRTGGSKNVPDGAGGGPQAPKPAEKPAGDTPKR